jgi:hypothetical protein
MSEGHLAGVAAQQIPGDSQHRPHERDDSEMQQKLVRNGERDGEQQQGRDEGQSAFREQHRDEGRAP